MALVIALPMALFAAVITFAGTFVIDNSVTAVNDRSLGAAARAIAEALGVDAGELTLDLPPAAFGMLENNARDNVYYAIRYRDIVVTGYDDLPHLGNRSMRDGESRFADSVYKGQPIRIVAEARRLPRIDGLVIVEVAETVHARQMVARQLMTGLVALEAALIVAGLTMIPLAMRWAMRPVESLSNALEQRAASDIAPLSLTAIPRELRPLVLAFNRLLTRLDGAIQGMRQFTADASHQMRTPLSILRTHVSVLKAGARIGPEALRSIADIEAASARLERLLTQLLALARLESRFTTLPSRDVELVPFVRAVAAEHGPDAARRGVSLEYEGDAAEGARANTNPDLLAELLANVIDNAIRYNDVGGSVIVRLVRTDDATMIEVEDDGPGIPEADRARALERFTRLVNDEDRPGSGLGLPIAHALSDALGMAMTLDAGSDGRGLLVRFCMTDDFSGASEDA